MTLRDDVLAEVEAFLVKHEVEPTKFSMSAMSDPNFVRDLRKGRRIWPETAEKVRTYIANHSSPNADQRSQTGQAA